jgi:hypothetical protein
LIVYSLTCAKGHAFEGWFASSAAFDAQAASGKLLCPMCHSRKVAKAPMAPALAASVGERSGSKPQHKGQEPIALPQASPPAMPEELRKMRGFMTGMRKYIEQNAHYVGKDFPEEARKIHYGEGEERHIYGEASLEDAADLVEEGIDVAPLPPDFSDVN